MTLLAFPRVMKMEEWAALPRGTAEILPDSRRSAPQSPRPRPRSAPVTWNTSLGLRAVSNAGAASAPAPAGDGAGAGAEPAPARVLVKYGVLACRAAVGGDNAALRAAGHAAACTAPWPGLPLAGPTTRRRVRPRRGGAAAGARREGGARRVARRVGAARAAARGARGSGFRRGG